MKKLIVLFLGIFSLVNLLKAQEILSPRPNVTDLPSIYPVGGYTFNSESDSPFSWPYDAGVVFGLKPVQSNYRHIQLLFSSAASNIKIRSKNGSNDSWLEWNSLVLSNNLGDVGIGKNSNLKAKLHIYNGGGDGSYPTASSRGDVIQFLESYNNGIEIGNSKGFNARKAWILARHSTADQYGKYYSTLHLQPDVGDKSQYKGVAIGYGANENINIGTHLAVNGNVGIGTSTPASELDINGTITLSGDSEHTIQKKAEGILSGAETTEIKGRNLELYAYDNAYLRAGSQDNIQFHAGSHERMRILPNGNIGIGTTDPGSYKLAVEGKIGAHEVVVTTDGWADFVFENDYNLMPLKELDNYIQENKHLPEIPTTAEVQENGVSVGEMNAKLLQKIEELTLYVIELQKQNEEQKKENEKQNQLIQKIIDTK